MFILQTAESTGSRATRLIISCSTIMVALVDLSAYTIPDPSRESTLRTESEWESYILESRSNVAVWNPNYFL